MPALREHWHKHEGHENPGTPEIQSSAGFPGFYSFSRAKIAGGEN
jgi:hypothetical protein